MRLRRLGHCFALSLFLPVISRPLLGQEVSTTILQLEEEIPVAGLSSAMTIKPIKCDSRGNIYVRFYNAARFFSAPVFKISSSGEKKAVFSAENVEGWGRADVMDFDVGNDGQVYLLGWKLSKDKRLEFAVISFDEDGRHRFTTPLKAKLDSVDRLAVFSTGEILVMGFREADDLNQTQIPGAAPQDMKGEKRRVEPFVAICDRGGNIIRQVEIPLDIPGSGTDAVSKKRYLSAGAIEGSSAMVGEDGNLYFLPRSEKSTVYVVSANGELVRILRVKPPSEKAEALDLGRAPAF